MYTKVCTQCKVELPLTDFFKRSDTIGYRSACKKCHGNLQDKVCPFCGIVHTGYKTNRKSNVCVTCYPKYRQAYNLLQAASYRAKKNGLAFDLTIEWLMDRMDTCNKTGITFTLLDNGSNYATRRATTPSIDKIDPYKGYTQDNCQVVCWWYNITKQQYTDEEVLSLCKTLVTFSDMSNAHSVPQMEEIEKEIT